MPARSKPHFQGSGEFATALGTCLVLLGIIAGLSTWLHPDLVHPELPVRPFLFLLMVYPSVFVAVLLLAGPRATARWWWLVRGVGIAGLITGAPITLMELSLPAQSPLMVPTLLLQMLCIPWLLPPKGDKSLALLSTFFRVGMLVSLLAWGAVSYAFSSTIHKRAAELAQGRPYCLSAPLWLGVYDSVALPASSDWLLFQRVFTYPVNIYYGRHRLEVTVFDGGRPLETYHWSIKNWGFEPGGFLTPIEDCKHVLRQPVQSAR